MIALAAKTTTEIVKRFFVTEEALRIRNELLLVVEPFAKGGYAAES